ncbi:MAG TPA: hypothetical protein ENK85_09765, partial [Saprospiraceae bacterium]|nr:hypothetical protein [Saprospiraceae bacterium]
MKNMNFKLIMFALMGLVFSISLAAQDDMYYQSGDDDNTNYYASTDSDDENDEFYEENYDDEEDYEYYYSSRIRRFHRHNRGFGFYDNFYVNQYFYDPFYDYGTTIYVVNDYYRPYRPWRHRRFYNSWAWNRPILSVNVYNNYGWNSWGSYPYYSYNDPFSCGNNY